MRAFRLFPLFLAAAAFPQSKPSETYLGLFMNGQRIGYASYITKGASLDGRPAVRTDSTTLIGAGLLGQAMQVRIDTVSWVDGKGAPLRISHRMLSGGREQRVDARFQGKSVALEIHNAGRKTQRTIPVPQDAPVADDPIAEFLESRAKVGAKRSFYILDPTTATFIRNELRLVGPKAVEVAGKKQTLTLVEVIDPRAPMRVFVSSKGDLVKVDGPMGIEMRPISKSVALSQPARYAPSVDLAFSNVLKTDKPLPPADEIERLKLRVTGRDLSRVPSDGHQTVTRDGDSWIVETHPPAWDADPKRTVAEAAQGQEAWTKPSLHIASDDPTIRAAARKAVGDADEVGEAAMRIRRYVKRTMRANAGIGVLRDAAEVLKTKEGVCRDYAILTAAMMRSAGIPARVASGLVNWDGSFYYHAWVEYWNGERWIGADSTEEGDQMSATHIKLADGSVEDAFTFTFLDKVKLEVLEVRQRTDGRRR